MNQNDRVAESIERGTTCKHCLFISSVFLPANDMTNREYWTFTEVFCYLHGTDECDGKEK